MTSSWTKIHGASTTSPWAHWWRYSGLTHIIGIYFAIFLFMLFYIRFVGRHSWLLTGILSVASPVFLFFFFEALLKILLPKGYSEPLFYPSV